MRHGCLKSIQNYGGKPYLSARINSYFAKFNSTHEVAASYYPESNGIAERSIGLLKDRLHHVNEDQKVYSAKEPEYVSECLLYGTPQGY